MNADDYFDTKIACNGGDSINKSFSIQDMNSLYSLIEKNPEDISFYINDNDFFVASQNNPNLKNIEIPWGYKTVDYFDQQTIISKDYYTINHLMKEEWEDNYIDLLSLISHNHSVPVFTLDHHLITYDCMHLTPSGAMFYSQLLMRRISLTMTESKTE